MSYSNNPFNPDQKYKGQVKSELKQADENFNILAQAFKDNDPTTGIVKHALVADNCNNCGGSGGSSTINDYLGIVPEVDLENETIDSWVMENLISNNPSYFSYFIQDTSPYNNPNYTTSKIWYDTNTNTLNILTQSGNLVAIDWRVWVRKDLWYGLRKLKIENNQLKISNDGSNWSVVFPYFEGDLIVDDTNSNDDNKIIYLFANISNSQSFKRIFGSYSKTRVACVSPSIWNITIDQNSNQNTAGWLGLHLGDIDISDGQGKMISNGSDFNTTGYSDISNAKFLPLAWLPAADGNQGDAYSCNINITITEDNKISVSSYISKSNNSNDSASFSCSGTLPSNAYHFGSFVLNGDSYGVYNYSFTRYIYKVNV